MYSLATLVYCLKWVFSNNTLSYLFVGLSGFAIFCGDQGSEGWEDRNEIHAAFILSHCSLTKNVRYMFSNPLTTLGNRRRGACVRRQISRVG